MKPYFLITVYTACDFGCGNPEDRFNTNFVPRALCHKGMEKKRLAIGWSHDNQNIPLYMGLMNVKEVVM